MGDSELNSLARQMQRLMENPTENSQRPEQQKQENEKTSDFEWNKVENPVKFIGGLLSKGVLCDGLNDSERNLGLKALMVQLAVKIVGLQGDADAIHGLTEALEDSGNSALVPALRTWVKQDFSIETAGDLKNKNFPVAVSNLRSFLSGHGARPDGLSKIATFTYPAGCAAKGTLALELDKEKMVACLADGTVKLWNWVDGEEKAIKFGEKGELGAGGHITSIQYDPQIVILGTSKGTVHLFDTKTQEEKWSVRLPDAVHSLRFVESTLIVLTQSGDGDKFWWVEISRADMRLRNQTPQAARTTTENSGIFIMNSMYTFLFNSNFVTMQYTTSGGHVPDGCFEAPSDISALNVLDLIPAKRLAVAGCQDGQIAIWTTVLNTSEEPAKTLVGHEEAIVSLCALNGHLLSLDQSGKLLMWSGYDLENKNVTALPRVLAEDFHNVTSLVAQNRWFVSSSPEDAIINVWTVPDVWLRAG